MGKPEPIPKNVVCSLCGLDWGKHGDKPTAMTCIELLKFELAQRPLHRGWNQPYTSFGNDIRLSSSTSNINPTTFSTGFITITASDDDDGPTPVPAVV